jgi:uncharacterized phage infection (PIP) family protein YhgE
MADFETVASATIEKLTDLEQTCVAAGEDFDSVRSRIRQLHESLTSRCQATIGLASQLEDLLREQRGAQEQVKENLLGRFDAIESSLTMHSGSLERELAEVVQQQQAVQEKINAAREAVETNHEAAVEAIESTDHAVDTCRDEAEEGFDDLATQWDEGVKEVDETETSLSERADELNSYLQDDLSERIQNSVEEVSSQLDERGTAVEGHFNELGGRFDETLQSTVSTLDSDLQNLVSSMTTKFEGFGQTAEQLLERLHSGTDLLVIAKDGMNEAVRTSCVGLESAVETLDEIKQIFEKIV